MSDSISPISSVVWADPAREHAFQTWLTPLAVQHGLELSTLRPASADASFRRYLRLDRSAGGSLIVMDAPPDKENCTPFVQVQGLMQQSGLNVPAILDWNQPDGFMLLSDMGSRTLIEVLDPARPQDAELWYHFQVAACCGVACCKSRVSKSLKGREHSLPAFRCRRWTGDGAAIT